MSVSKHQLDRFYGDFQVPGEFYGLFHGFPWVVIHVRGTGSKALRHWGQWNGTDAGCRGSTQLLRSMPPGLGHHQFHPDLSFSMKVSMVGL